MALKVGELFAELNLKDSKFNQGLQNSSRNLKNMGSNVSGVGKTLTKTLTTAITGATLAMGGIIKKTANHADEIAKSSRKMGIHSDALQEIRYASEQMGVSTDDMDRALGRLNQRMGRAAEGNEKYQKALQDVGVDLQGVKDGTISTDDAFMTAIGTLGEMDDAQRQSAVASELFGTKMARELMPIIREGVEDFDELRQRAAELGIVLDEDVLKASENLNDGLDDLKQAFGGIIFAVASELIPILADELIPLINEEIIPVLKDWAENLGELIEWLVDLDPEIWKLVGSVLGFLAGAGPMLIIIGKLITFLGLILSPIGIVTTAILGLSAMFIEAYRSSEEFREIIHNAMDAVEDIITEVVSFITDFWEEHSEEILDTTLTIFQSISDFIVDTIVFISEIIEEILGFISDVWDENGETIMNIVDVMFSFIEDTVGTVIGVVYDIITDTLDLLAEFWDENSEQIMEIISFLFSFIEEVVSVAMPIIQEIIETVLDLIMIAWDFLSTTVMEIVSGLISLLTGDWEGLSESLDNITDAMTELIIDLFDFLFGDIIDMLTGWISDFISDIVQFKDDVVSDISDMIGDITTLFSDMISDAFDWGKNLISGFIDGIKSMVGAVGDAVSGVVDSAKSFLGFSSPAEKGEGRHIVDWGENMIDGFLDGTKKMLPDVEKTMSGLTGLMGANVQPVSASSAGNSRSETYNDVNITVHAQDGTDAGKKIADQLRRLKV